MTDMRAWTSDQHKAAGDELLAQAHVALDEDVGDDTAMIERVEASAGYLASIAAAHYAAAQLLLTKHHVAKQSDVDSRWNWRGATV